MSDKTHSTRQTQLLMALLLPWAALIHAPGIAQEPAGERDGDPEDVQAPRDVGSSAPLRQAGEADERSADISDPFAANLVRRPINMPAGTLRTELTVAVVQVRTLDAAVAINLGVAYGVTDALEVGVSGERQGFRRTLTGLVPLIVTPSIDYLGPFVYFRGRLFRSSVFELGLEGGLQFPVGVRSSILVASPFRLRAGNFFSLDGGLQAGVSFSGPLVYTLETSLQPRVATDSFYVGANIAFSTSFQNDERITTIPLGFEAGVVLTPRRARLDLFASFEWSNFYIADHRLGLSARSLDIWTLQVGLRSYMGLGG